MTTVTPDAVTPAARVPAPAGAFRRALRAELFALRRRPGVLVLSTVWALQMIVFAYTVLYVVYRTAGLEPADAEVTIALLLPGSTGFYAAGSMPLYGGPVMLCIGAVIAAGDHRLGTLRTLLARFPDRRTFVLARLTGLAIAFAGVAALTMLVSVVSSGVIALVEGRPLDYPGLGTLALGLAATWLIVAAWGAVGFALGTLTRAALPAIGIGLVWAFGVEQLLVGGLAGAIPAFEAVRAGLLGPSSGSLAAAIGAVGSGSGAGGSGTPGVAAVTPGPVAALVLLTYVLVAAVVAVVVFRRREVG